MNEKILTNVGLTQEQAKIYLFLLDQGFSPAKIIALKTGIGRALTYKVLEQLVVQKRAKKRENLGKTPLFFPTHPQHLKDFVDKKQQTTEQAVAGLSSIFGTLTSEFNMLLGKPNVQFFEGVDGLKKIHDDILETEQEIRIISSPIEERSEVIHLIREQIEKQAAKNIQTKAITTDQSGRIFAFPVSEDEKYLVTRKIVPQEHLTVPAQIIVYGDKVTITNFKESIISVLIDSKYVADTFRVMFDYMWNKTL